MWFTNIAFRSRRIFSISDDVTRNQSAIGAQISMLHLVESGSAESGIFWQPGFRSTLYQILNNRLVDADPQNPVLYPAHNIDPDPVNSNSRSWISSIHASPRRGISWINQPNLIICIRKYKVQISVLDSFSSRDITN